MARSQPVQAKPGKRSGEFVVSLPPGWELRLRRILKTIAAENLPDPREPGLSEAQREARIRTRRQRMQSEVCRYIADVLSADIVGKEVALSTRNRYGVRRGSLREHVQAVLRETED
jgi:hypothetical protein